MQRKWKTAPLICTVDLSRTANPSLYSHPRLAMICAISTHSSLIRKL